MVKDNWREALRLCAACCGDDDVDEILLAILKPLPGEDPEKTARARAVLALSCLADEPNVSEKVVQQIIHSFACKVDERDGRWPNVMTTADSAAIELAGLEWGNLLRAELVREFCRRKPFLRNGTNGLCAMMGMAAAPKDEKEFQQWLLDQVNRLKSSDGAEAVEATFLLIIMAFENRSECVAGMVEGLFGLLDKNGPAAHAAAWALGLLNFNKKWAANSKETEKLIDFISDPSSDIGAVYWTMYILGNTKDTRAVAQLIKRLADEDDYVRSTSLEALAKICEDKIDRKLLTSHLDSKWFWIDPQDPIAEKIIEKEARELKMPAAEVHRRYEQLAEKYNLKLGWKH